MSEREVLAGELALRLVEGEELLAARRLLAEDPGFAAEVIRWEEQLAPLFDEIAERPLPAGIWARIEAALARGADPVVLALRRQVRRWRTATGIAGAAAMAAAFALLLVPGTAPPPVTPPIALAPGPVLVASVDAGTSAAVGLAYLSDRKELLIVPARLAVPDGRARQLWLIPEGQAPISLGLVEGAAPQRRPLDAALQRQFARGATIAISDEPSGGSPTGQPTGAVLGTGILQQS